MSTEQHFKQNFIGGQWVDSKGGKQHQVINPATEEPASTIVLGTAADVAYAVAAAKAAFKRSEEHKFELQSLMRILYAVTCLKIKRTTNRDNQHKSYNKQYL